MAQASTGQRVLVTGGGSGIGLAIASGFLDQGASVLACDRDESALAAAAASRPGLLTVGANAADEADVDRVFEEVASRWGGLDVLVNNVGIAGPTGGLESLSLDGWRETMSVNVDSQFLCARRAIPMLREAGGGAIVNIASTAGLMGYAMRSPYAASKWAVVGLTKTLAMELGTDRIRVNAICPGAIDGPRMDRVIADEARASGQSQAAIREGYVGTTSMRTFIDAREIADTVLFLCSHAGRHISGQALCVDGHTETSRAH